MALDRTWYNSLVDDDGSGMVGSVWDKADVDSLMDAVDSEISRIDGVGRRQPWSPIIQNASGGTLSATLGAADYSIVGDILFYRFSFGSIAIPASTAYIRAYPLPVPPRSNNTDETMIRIWMGTSEWGSAVATTDPFLKMSRAADQAFPAGTAFILGTGFYYIR